MINHISASDFYLNINNKQVTKIFSFKLSYKPPEPKAGPGLAQINFENLQKKTCKELNGKTFIQECIQTSVELNVWQ